jgi:hypothetical protein
MITNNTCRLGSTADPLVSRSSGGSSDDLALSVSACITSRQHLFLPCLLVIGVSIFSF